MRSKVEATMETKITPRWRSLALPLTFICLYSCTGAAFVLSGVEFTTLTPLAILAPVLIIASQTDLVTHRIPDWCSGSIAIGGLAFALTAGPLWVNLLTAISVLIALWLLSHLYWKKFGREALGLGDVKLIAACAIWLGPLGLCTMLFLASSGGIIAALTTRAFRKQYHTEEVPFGPFLAYGFFLVVGMNASTKIGSSLI